LTTAGATASIATRVNPYRIPVPSIDQNSLSSVLACPRCGGGPVSLTGAGWICGSCSSGFPVIGGIPWLFPEPRQALADWRGRLGLLTQHLASEAKAIRAAEADAPAPRRAVGWPTRRPPTTTRSGGCVNCWRRLDLRSRRRRGDARLGTPLPLEQGLTNYYVNLHRDWAWGAEENAAGLDEIVQVLGGSARGLGRTLVHGAGAGRLAYDLHAAGDAPLTVGTDFNPLLLMVAREMYAGRSLELYEFPIAPRGVEDHAILRKLASPGAARPGLELVAADALQGPFADGAFDTVITHWFIDIVGEPFARVAARINLALSPAAAGSIPAHWLSRAAHAERIGLDEALERCRGPASPM
jgi:uncharacterized protein YbaR (Trm112 family)